MKLYEINAAIAAILDDEVFIDTDTGEVFDRSSLDSIEMNRTEKIENIALYLKDLKARKTAIDAEIDTLKKRTDTLDRRIERLTDYLKGCIDVGEKVETARCVISTRRTKRVEVDAEKLPIQYWHEKVSKTFDKVELRHALDAGTEIPGAVIVEDYSLQIK